MARKLVVFDLDGTLTWHDSLGPFVVGYCRQHPWRFLGLPGALPASIAFLLRLSDHGRVKAALLRSTLRGSTRESIQAWTARFVPHLIAHGMRAEALKVLETHRQNGDYLVLLSASPDLYVPAIGAALGFTETICTGVRWSGDCLEGSLTTHNRRDEEKTRILRKLREQHPDLHTVAYANGPGDLEHLKLADAGVLVNAPVWLRRKGEQLGLVTGEWR